MMVLVGKQMVDFVGKDGPVKGVKLHFTDDSRNDVEGCQALTQFVRRDNPLYTKACTIPLGEFDIRYGYGGKIMDLVSLED